MNMDPRSFLLPLPSAGLLNYYPIYDILAFFLFVALDLVSIRGPICCYFAFLQ